MEHLIASLKTGVADKATAFLSSTPAIRSVFALIGDKEEIHTNEMVAQFAEVLEYQGNHASQPNQLLDGVNLDIEPWIEGRWDDIMLRDTESIQYLNLLDGFMQAKAAASLTLPVGAAIASFLDHDVPWGANGTQPMYEHIQDTLDYVAVMGFRDTAWGEMQTLTS